MICGFPGETELEYQETVAFAKEIGFARMHIFPYSARQGTPAAQMSSQVPKALREERARLLIREAAQLAQNYMESFIGQDVQVLLEEEEDGFMRGYTAEYIPCRIKAGKPGEMKTASITQVLGEELLGE